MRKQIKKSGNSYLIRISVGDMEAYNLQADKWYDLELSPIKNILPISEDLIKDIKKGVK